MTKAEQIKLVAEIEASLDRLEKAVEELKRSIEETARQTEKIKEAFKNG